jgi:hypothetical protein
VEARRSRPKKKLGMMIGAPVGVVLVVAGFWAAARGTPGVRAPAAGRGPAPLPDGKYTNVTVEGRVVPMINVKDDGAVVLVDTDGKKPRAWEEQFRRQGDIPNGTYDIHKTDVNGNGSFGDDPVDRRGTWTIDAHGNITSH